MGWMAKLFVVQGKLTLSYTQELQFCTKLMYSFNYCFYLYFRSDI